MPRLLLALLQMPQDPASGAARTAQTACEMAADAGWEVQAIGTTATERGAAAEPTGWLKSLGLNVSVQPAAGKRGRHLRFTQRGIGYTLLDVRTQDAHRWESTHARAFDYLFETETARFRPDVILTYGGSEAHMARLRRAQRAGSRIAFCVFNTGYLVPGFFDGIDAVLTPSEFLARKYRDAIGLESTPLPTPVEFADVLAEDHEPIFVTMVNPSVEKGLYFFARLAEVLATRHPQIPMLAVEARGTAGMLAAAGLAGGFDLRRHESLMFAPATARPADLFQPARVLVAPSVVEEASARVVAEALVNGVPPVVGDRGGMAESCNGAGFVLPLPADLTLETRIPPPAEAVEPWVRTIALLCEDEAFYQEQSARARAASEIYRREILAPRYVRFFESVLDRPAATSAGADR